MGCLWSVARRTQLGALVVVPLSITARVPLQAQMRREAELTLDDLGLRGRLGLVVAVDYTASNAINGARTFARRCLHTIALTGGHTNPYEEVLAACEPLHTFGAPVDTQGVRAPLRAYGFGDVHTCDRAVFSFLPPGAPACTSLDDVVARYREITPQIVMGGPTSYVAAVQRAAECAEESELATALVLVVDGAPANMAATRRALTEASRLALYVVAIGVGDNSFAALRELEREAGDNNFANFSFVHYSAAEQQQQQADAWRGFVAARIMSAVARQARAARDVGAKFS